MVHSSQQTTQQQANPERRPVNWAFRLLAVVTGLFILTIFVMVAVTMADPTIPANQRMSDWFDRNAMTLLTGEVALIGLLLVVAFRLERREAWRQYDHARAAYEARMQARLEPSTTESSTSEDRP